MPVTSEQQGVLDIIQTLESQEDMTPTWRMVYRRFAGDDYRLREILASLLGQGKITETIINANAVYHTI